MNAQRHFVRGVFVAVAATTLCAAGTGTSQAFLQGGDLDWGLSFVAGRAPVVSGTPATSNLINSSAVAVDSSGNAYIADAKNGQTGGAYVEKVTPNGTLTIVAGNGLSDAAPTAGPATSSSVLATAVATDASGDVYIADIRGYIEKVTPSGNLSIVAGNGVSQGAPRPGTATSSPLGVRAIVVDSAGNIYAADHTYVVKVTPSGVLSVVAGNGSGGNGVAPVPGPATSSPMVPDGVALDAYHNLYISDDDGYLDKVTSGGTLRVIAGDGQLIPPGTNNPAKFGSATSNAIWPLSVAVDSSGIAYFSDMDRHIYKVTAQGTLSAVAGDGAAGALVPGPATATALAAGQLVAEGTGDLYVATGVNIVKVTSAGDLSIVAGTGGSRAPIPGPALSSYFNGDSAIATDASGDVFVADTTNNLIEEMKPSSSGTYVVSVIAGTGSYGSDPVSGPATQSDIGWPDGVAVDANGNVFVADCLGRRVEELTPSSPGSTSYNLAVIAGTGDTSSDARPIAGPATSSPLNCPAGLAVDSSDDVFVADNNDARVEELTPTSAGSQSYNLSFLAGTGVHGLPTNGPALASEVNNPVDVALDQQGDLFVSDAANNEVYKLVPAGDGSYSLTVIAGSGGLSGEPVPGAATSSRLNQPDGLTVNRAGDVFLVDRGNAFVEELAPSAPGSDSYGLSEIAGRGAGGTPTVGRALLTDLYRPLGVALDPAGNLLVTDNNMIEQLTPLIELSSQATSVTFGPGAWVGVPATGVLTGTWVAGSTTLPPQYQWYRVDGPTWVPIAGATSKTYVPTSTMAGQNLGLRVSAQSPDGYWPATSVSTGPITVGRGTLKTTLPRVSGTTVLGQTLHAVPGLWKAGAVTLTGSHLRYQWYANGVAIKGATWSVLKLARYEVGKSIGVRVTGSYPGYTTVARFSARTSRIRS